MLVIIAVIVLVAIVLGSLAVQQRSLAAHLADLYQRQEKLFSAAVRWFKKSGSMASPKATL